MRKLELVVAVLATLFYQQPAPDNQPQKPVKFAVVDQVTKKPLTEFSYWLSIKVPGEIGPTRAAKEPDRVDVKSPAGTFVVQAPASCKLELDVVSPDVVVGFQHNQARSFSLLASDAKREFVVGVEVGTPVRGVVRDAVTKKPIAGANIAPIIDMHQARGPFRERAVKTDADGRFEVRGVNPDWGALVEHRTHKSRLIAYKKRGRAAATRWWLISRWGNRR